VISAVMLILAKLFSKTFLILLLLPALILIIIGVIMSIADLIKGEKIKKQ
jgi:succinate dehydrogenase hydrophobic anchor subunit